MEHIAEFRNALENLLEELAHYDAKTEDAPPETDAETSMLHELSGYLSETTDDIHQVLSGHPVAAAGAAFLLGVAVGRLSR